MKAAPIWLNRQDLLARLGSIIHPLARSRESANPAISHDVPAPHDPDACTICHGPIEELGTTTCDACDEQRYW